MFAGYNKQVKSNVWLWIELNDKGIYVSKKNVSRGQQKKKKGLDDILH